MRKGERPNKNPYLPGRPADESKENKWVALTIGLLFGFVGLMYLLGYVLVHITK